jgi:class 3 adenylate cyclase
LLRLNLVREGDFLRVFAELYSTRFVKADKLRTLTLDEPLLERVGVRTSERLKMCPIRWDPATHELHVVASVPLSATLEPELRQVVGARAVTVYVATPAGVAALIQKGFHGREDAFAQVTANGAGLPFQSGEPAYVDLLGSEPTTLARVDVSTVPQGPVATLPTDRPPILLQHPEPPRGARDAPTQALPPGPGPASTDGKTVMVSLEAMTIATLRRENARYRIAQEFHRRVSLERDVATMARRILEVIFELLPADGAAMWLNQGQFFSRAKEGPRQIEVPRAVIDQALASPTGLLTHNALVDQRFDRSESVLVRGVKSVMAMPLRSGSATIGILYVESVSMSAAFTDEDLPLLDSIAAQASLLLDNAALVAQVQHEVETRASLSRFLSQAAVEEVLSGRLKVKLEGQSTDLTVLFADIRGFTTLSAHLRPEEVVRFLNDFFTEAVDAVEKHGGIVDKFIGDCVMALWGAVKPRELEARHAIKAALELVERGARIRVNGAPLQVGVGINTGQAVVGAIGGKRRLDYTAIGATVNLAARLCGIAEAGEVLITAETLMRAGPGVMNDASEAVMVKGLDVPIVPYRVRAIVQPLQLSQVHGGRGGAPTPTSGSPRRGG